MYMVKIIWGNTYNIIRTLLKGITDKNEESIYYLITPMI